MHATPFAEGKVGGDSASNALPPTIMEADRKVVEDYLPFSKFHDCWKEGNAG